MTAHAEPDWQAGVVCCSLQWSRLCSVAPASGIGIPAIETAFWPPPPGTA